MKDMVRQQQNWKHKTIFFFLSFIPNQTVIKILLMQHLKALTNP